MNPHRPSGPPGSENAPADNRGARKNLPASNDARAGGTGKPQQDHEDRRNAAACFPNKRKTENWHPDYTGVAVVEGVKDGDKFWVNVYVRTSSRGEKYITVVLKPRQER